MHRRHCSSVHRPPQSIVHRLLCRIHRPALARMTGRRPLPIAGLPIAGLPGNASRRRPAPARSLVAGPAAAHRPARAAPAHLPGRRPGGRPSPHAGSHARPQPIAPRRLTGPADGSAHRLAPARRPGRSSLLPAGHCLLACPAGVHRPALAAAAHCPSPACRPPTHPSLAPSLR